MKKIQSKKILLNDFCVRLFIKYKDKYCSDIRIWKLPKNNNLFSMFNNKNLFWAVSGDESKTLQGWFSKDGDLLSVLSKKIEKCENEEDLKKLCLNFENIIRNGIPLDI